jgi:hypothetical protein
VRARVEPGVEGLAAARDDAQVVAVAVAAQRLDRRAAEAVAPPAVGTAVGVVDGERRAIAALLRRGGARQVGLPGGAAIEAAGAAGRRDVVALDVGAARGVEDRLGCASQALAR